MSPSPLSKSPVPAAPSSPVATHLKKPINNVKLCSCNSWGKGKLTGNLVFLLCNFGNFLLDLAEFNLHGVNLLLELRALSFCFVHAVGQFFDQGTDVIPLWQLGESEKGRLTRD